MCGKGLFGGDDGVGEGADAFDGDGNGVARGDVANTGWGAAVDEVAWIEGGEGGKMGNEPCDGEDHEAAVAILAEFTVEIGAHREVLWVFDVGDDPWAEGFVGWLGFCAQPLFVGVLIGAVGNVVAAGVTEDVVQGVGFADAAAAAADDSDEFAFVVDGVVEAADSDRRVRAGDGC